MKKPQSNTDHNFKAKISAIVLILLCSTSIATALTNLNPAYGSTQNTSISGTITDSDGAGIQDASVTIANANGAQITTSYTNSFGDFVVLNVEFGTYSLIVTKTGYAQITRSVTINAFGQQMGTIILAPALNISTTILSQAASLGDQITFPFTLRNSGGDTETAVFSIASPEEWSARVLSGTTGITKLSVPAGQSISLQLEVNVPSTAPVGQTYNVTLTALGSVNASITTNSSMTFAVEIGKSSVSGRIVDENGNGLSGASITAYSSSAIVIGVAQSYSDGSFTLDAPKGKSVSLHFIKSGYVEVTKTVALTTDSLNLGVISLSKAVSLTSSIMSTVANGGDQITIPFTVKNSGNAAEEFALTVSVPDGWSASVSNGNTQVTRVSLPAGQSIALQLVVSVPSLAALNADYNISVTASGSVSVSLGFTVSTRAQALGSIIGRATDESGTGLSDVEINAYSPLGVLLKTAQTTSDGSFAFSLPTGDSISLRLSKPGYSTVTKSVTLASEGKVADLGDVTFTKGVSLTSSVSSAVTSPGKLLIPFSVANAGSAAEAVSFSVTCPFGWTTRILDSTGREVAGASVLPSGQGSNFQLEVNVPLGTTGTHSMTLVSSGKTMSTLAFTVEAKSTNASVISCQFPGKSATPGDSVRFNIAVSNPFSDQTRYQLSVVSVPANWTAAIKTSSGDSVTEVALNPGESVNLVVQVESSAAAATGQVYGISISAKPTGYNVSDSLQLSVDVAEATNEVTLTASLPEIAITAGNVASYSVTVANLGITDRLLFLSADVPSGWTAIFKSGNAEVTTLNLYAGNTSALTIVVTPPSTVGVDSYSIPIQVKSENGALMDALNLTTTVTGSYGVTLTLSTYLTSTDSGGTTSFTGTVTNSGYSTITGVVLDITLPESDWTQTVTPVQVGTLGPKESASFTVSVATTDSTVSGDYMITVAASSDQVSSSSSSQVRVTVSTPTSWGIYGVGVAVAFIVALVLVFRKFKRR